MMLGPAIDVGEPVWPRFFNLCISETIDHQLQPSASMPKSVNASNSKSSTGVLPSWESSTTSDCGVIQVNSVFRKSICLCFCHLYGRGSFVSPPHSTTGTQFFAQPTRPLEAATPLSATGFDGHKDYGSTNCSLLDPCFLMAQCVPSLISVAIRVRKLFMQFNCNLISERRLYQICFTTCAGIL